MLRTTISAVLLFTASVYAQSLRVVGSGDASRMPGACAFPTDVYACTASTCLSPLYTCGSNGQSWTPVVMADSSGNIHTGGACPANAPAGSVCSNGAVLGSPTGPAGGAVTGTYPTSLCIAGITCGTVVPTTNCTPGTTPDYLNTATATRYYC